MLEQKILKWVIIILIVGVAGYALFLSLDDQWRFVYLPEQPNETIDVQIDHAIPMVALESKQQESTDTVALPSHSSAAVAVLDSDSLVRYNLYRKEQARVNIDMEEHKEAIFFTWEDIQSYFGVIADYFKKKINKQSNDDN